MNLSPHNMLIMNRLAESRLQIRYQYAQCYRCLSNNVTLPPLQNGSYSLWPHFTVDLVAFVSAAAATGDSAAEHACSSSFLIEEDTQYALAVERFSGNASLLNCTLSPMRTDMDMLYLLPLYVLLVLLCLACALYYAVLQMYRHRLLQRVGSRLFLYQVDSIEDLGSPAPAPNVLLTDDDDGEEDDEDENSARATGTYRTPPRKRIKAVDTFRGISVVLMVFVNYGGGQYWFLQHSIWNGITLADLVFPWFVFVMGVTVALTLFKLALKRLKKVFLLNIWLRAAKRSCLLFAIGLGLENPRVASLRCLRVMGPLQRLALAYLALVSFICLEALLRRLSCRRRRRRRLLCPSGGRLHHHDAADAAAATGGLLLESSEINARDGDLSHLGRLQQQLADLAKCWPLLLASVALLVAHGAVSLLVVMDAACPRGYLGPGGISDFGQFPNCTGGVAAAIDRAVLTPWHMYRTPSCMAMYNTTQPFDPEGLLGSLSSTSLCFLGYWAGNVMLMNKQWAAVMKRLLLYTALSTALGTGLCYGSLNEGLIPINKNLWSVSYVLVSAGTCFCLLALLFGMIDVLKIWSGAPFRFPGMNALVIYAGHELLKTTFPIQWRLEMKHSHSFHLAMNVWGAVFWTGVGYVMYVKKLFITV